MRNIVSQRRGLTYIFTRNARWFLRTQALCSVGQENKEASLTRFFLDCSRALYTMAQSRSYYSGVFAIGRSENALVLRSHNIVRKWRTSVLCNPLANKENDYLRVLKTLCTLIETGNSG